MNKIKECWYNKQFPEIFVARQKEWPKIFEQENGKILIENINKKIDDFEKILKKFRFEKLLVIPLPDQCIPLRNCFYYKSSFLLKKIK